MKMRMRPDSEVVALIVFALFGFFGGTLVSLPSMPKEILDIFNPLATLLASFLGAWYAFKLQNDHRLREEKSKNMAAGNTALRIIIFKINELIQYSGRIPEEYAADKLNPFLIRPVLDFNKDDMNIDISTIDFLLKKDSFKIIVDLNLEIERYRYWVQLTNERSKFYLEVVMKRMAEAGLVHGRIYSLQEQIDILGHNDYAKLLNMTKSHYEILESNIKSLVALKNDLRAVLKIKYSDEYFFDINVDE